MPEVCSARATVYTTLLSMVPPNKGCGWHTIPYSGCATPSASWAIASRTPAGPGIASRSRPPIVTRGSLDAYEIHIEHERCAGRNDITRPTVAVREVRRYDESALPADLHAGHALIPSLDHLAGAQLEAERRAALQRAVELLALVVRRRRLVQPAGVLHDGILSGGDRGTAAVCEVGDLEVIYSARGRGGRVIRRRLAPEQRARERASDCNRKESP